MRSQNKMTTTLNKKERRAAQLLAHYATCERLARQLGGTNPDGKKISVALWKIERFANEAATDYCNGDMTSDQWEARKEFDRANVAKLFGKLPPGFFVNNDPRGYALKIDNETPEGAALIAAVKLHTDWGGFGILSPEIDGN